MSIEEQRAAPDGEQGAPAVRRKSVRASKAPGASPAQPSPAPTAPPERSDPRDALAAAFADHLGTVSRQPEAADTASPRSPTPTSPASTLPPEDGQPPAEASDKIHRLGQQLLRMPAPLSDFDRRAIRAMATELIEIEEQLESHAPGDDGGATVQPDAASDADAPTVVSSSPFLWPSGDERATQEAAQPGEQPATSGAAAVVEPPADERAAAPDAVATTAGGKPDRERPSRVLLMLGALLVALLILLITFAVVHARQGSHRSSAGTTSNRVSSVAASVTGAPAAATQPSAAPTAPASVAQTAAAAATTASAVQSTGAASATASAVQPAVSAAGATATSTGTSAPATTASASPAAAPPTAVTFVQRVAQAEGGLRTGELSVVSDLGAGAKATATLTFDLGDAQHPPRLHITSVYSSPAGTQTDERIIIGGTAWLHQPNGQWVTTDETEGVWGRVQAYLPRASAAANPTVEGSATPILHWNDATRGAAVTLHFDPITGIPSELQLTPSGGPAVDVHYGNWNAPVTINQPSK